MERHLNSHRYLYFFFFSSAGGGTLVSVLLNNVVKVKRTFILHFKLQEVLLCPDAVLSCVNNKS